MRTTNATVGSNYDRCRSFAPTYTASSTAEAAIARGSYEVCASTDAVLRLGVTGMGAATTLPTSQPAEASRVAMFQLFAGQRTILDVDFDSAFFRVIGVTASGTLTFNGPLASSTNA